MIDTTNTSYGYLSEPVVDNGMLNEQGVMNVALSFFDRTRNLIDDAMEKEVILFKQILPISIVFCSSMSDWNFITNTIEYDEDDIYNDDPVLCAEYSERKGKFKGEKFFVNGEEKYHVYSMYKNFIYAYRLPNDFLKMRYIDGDAKKGFAVKGNLIYCNELGCDVDYISTKLTNIPVDFGYLIAYKCAMELSMHLDHEGTALTRASAMLQQTFSVMKQRDDMNYRLQNPAQNHYVDKSTAYWNNGGIRK